LNAFFKVLKLLHGLDWKHEVDLSHELQERQKRKWLSVDFFWSNEEERKTKKLIAEMRIHVPQPLTQVTVQRKAKKAEFLFFHRHFFN